jgi:hypothetical protein
MMWPSSVKVHFFSRAKRAKLIAPASPHDITKQDAAIHPPTKDGGKRFMEGPTRH